MGHIWEGVRKHREKMANNVKIKVDISFLKQRAAAGTTGNVSPPTKAIRAQLANTTITQQPISHMPQGDMFSSSSGGGGNLFPKPEHPPATEAEKATLKANLELYPIQPATPEGEAAYLDQLRAGRRTNGPNHVTKTTGFRLQPGGACYELFFFFDTCLPYLLPSFFTYDRHAVRATGS